MIGKKASDQDVLLSFAGGQISLTAKGGGSAMVTIAYKSVVRGTYTKARDPRWDASLPSPTEKLDLPGLIKTARTLAHVANAHAHTSSSGSRTTIGTHHPGGRDAVRDQGGSHR